jgi:hypothetical protein
MATYLIGYDLNRPGQDYEDLFAAIKALVPSGIISTRPGSLSPRTLPKKFGIL